MTAVAQNAVTMTWVEANQAYLQAELRRLRLLFARKVRWLRWNWQRDPLGSNHSLVISDALADRLLSDDETEEFRFYQEDPECSSITNTLKEVEFDLVTRRQQLTEDGGIASLEALARLFGLQPIERDVLMLCFAIDDQPAFATLAAYIQDNVNARYATFEMVLNVLCQTQEEREGAREALLGSSPLHRFRLLMPRHDVAATRSCHPLRIDERISDYIRGVNRLDDKVVHMLRMVPPEPVVGIHRELLEQLCRWTESTAGQSWPPFHFTGPSGCGKRGIAREFCARIGVELYSLDPKRLPLHDIERHELIHLMDRESVLSRIAIYIDLSDVDSSDRTIVAAVQDWVELAGGIVFVGAHERWQFRRRMNHVPVPRLDAAGQHQIWATSLERVTNAVDGQLDTLVQQFDMGPGAIPNAVAAAIAKAQSREGDFMLLAGDLWQACRELSAWRIDGLAQRLTPCYAWDDIVLPSDLMRQLREIANQVSARPIVYESWGFGARLLRGRGISALFSGPSGTGKTMAAEILANSLNLDLYRIDLAGVVSKYIGETEKNLRNVFDAAEQSGAILFFDEADALFGKRTEVRDSHDRYANIEVNYLLQRMEDYRGLDILCTNRRTALDRAFLRRLRFLLEFPFPSSENRRLIWSKAFPTETPLSGLDLDGLARLEITGGNIRNIALNAAFLAASEGASVQMAHVLHAARREYAKIDKLLTEAEFGANYTFMTS